MAANNTSNSDYNDTIFFEDFTSDHINRDHWNVMVTGDVFNKEQQAYVDSVETIYTESGHQIDANGVLVIHPRYKQNFFTNDGQTFDFISGRIDTKGKIEFTHGNLSARIKMSPGTGVWPAFWLIGQGSWPGCGEIDIMEFVGESDWYSAAVHGIGYSGDAALVNYHYFSSEHDVSKWHVYSITLEEDKFMEFRIDENIVFRVTKPMIEYFSPWVFNQPKHIVLNVAVGGGYPYKINGVKKPYFGLPEETVQAIMRNDVRFMVDWVKISNSSTN